MGPSWEGGAGRDGAYIGTDEMGFPMTGGGCVTVEGGVLVLGGSTLSGL